MDALIEAGLEYKSGLEYRPGVWHNCTNRGRGLLFEEIRYPVDRYYYASDLFAYDMMQ